MKGDVHDDPNELLRAIHCPDLAEKIGALMRAQEELVGAKDAERSAALEQSNLWMRRAFAAEDAFERARGLVADLLALNPSVSGDMEKVRVYADVLKRLGEFAGGGR